MVVDKQALEHGKVNILHESHNLSDVYEIPSNGTCIVGCGYPSNGEDVSVVIVNPDSLEKCLDNEVSNGVFCVHKELSLS